MTYFECFVPTTRHDTAVVWSFYPVDCPNWTFMLNKTKKQTSRITYSLYTILFNLLFRGTLFIPEGKLRSAFNPFNQ